MRPDSASLWESIRATDEQRHRINETLRDGERLLWLGRPKPGTGKQLATWGSLVFAVVFYYFWLAMLWPFFSNVNMQDPPWFSLLLFTAIALLPLTGIASLLPRLWAGRCDVYAVTNRRAIALIRGPFHYMLDAWDAQDYQEITRCKNGTGSIIYEYRHTRRSSYPVGLLDLPDVETVAALVAAASQGAAYVETESQETPPPEQNGGLFLMIFGVLFAAFASIFLVVGLNRMNTERDLESRGVQTTATVLKVREHISDGGRRGGSVTYAPVLRFADTAGVQQEIESSFGSSDYNFPIGQQVIIRYMPNSPSTLCIVDDSANPGTILALVGGIFVLIGLGIFAIGMKWRKHNRV